MTEGSKLRAEGQTPTQLFQGPPEAPVRLAGPPPSHLPRQRQQPSLAVFTDKEFQAQSCHTAGPLSMRTAPAQGLSAEGPLQMASRLHSPIWSSPSKAGVTSLKELHPPKLTSWLPLPTVPRVKLQGDTGSRATHKLRDSNYHALAPRLLVTRPMPGMWSARSWSRKRILALQQRSSLSRGFGFLQIQEQQTSADHLTKGSASQEPESPCGSETSSRTEGQGLWSSRPQPHGLGRSHLSPQLGGSPVPETVLSDNKKGEGKFSFPRLYSRGPWHPAPYPLGSGSEPSSVWATALRVLGWSGRQENKPDWRPTAWEAASAIS